MMKDKDVGKVSEYVVLKEGAWTNISCSFKVPVKTQKSYAISAIIPLLILDQDGFLKNLLF